MAKRIPSTCKSPNNENKSIFETAAEFVRMKDLIMYLTLSQSTIWRKVRAGEFPQPIKLSEAVTAWKTSDVRAWIQNVGNNSASITTAVNS
jgi:predicted DNA-binding transcriptional regulator AlpA